MLAPAPPPQSSSQPHLRAQGSRQLPATDLLPAVQEQTSTMLQEQPQPRCQFLFSSFLPSIGIAAQHHLLPLNKQSWWLSIPTENSQHESRPGCCCDPLGIHTAKATARTRVVGLSPHPRHALPAQGAATWARLRARACFLDTKVRSAHGTAFKVPWPEDEHRGREAGGASACRWILRRQQSRRV